MHLPQSVPRGAATHSNDYADVVLELPVLTDRRSTRLELVEYDLSSGRAEDDIADPASAWAAWFVDPATNTIGVLQYR